LRKRKRIFSRASTTKRRSMPQRGDDGSGWSCPGWSAARALPSSRTQCMWGRVSGLRSGWWRRLCPKPWSTNAAAKPVKRRGNGATLPPTPLSRSWPGSCLSPMSQERSGRPRPHVGHILYAGQSNWCSSPGTVICTWPRSRRKPRSRPSVISTAASCSSRSLMRSVRPCEPHCGPASNAS